MVRLKDIAEACGVSVATVSRALNGLTNENRERTSFICQTARDMGYYPNAAARTLKTSRSNNLGILFSVRAAMPNPITMNMPASAAWTA